MKTLTGLPPGRVQPQAVSSRLPLVPGVLSCPLVSANPLAHILTLRVLPVGVCGGGGERGCGHGTAPSEDTAAPAAAPALKGRHTGTLGGGARPGHVSRTAPHQTGGDVPTVVAEPPLQERLGHRRRRGWGGWRGVTGTSDRRGSGGAWVTAHPRGGLRKPRLSPGLQGAADPGRLFCDRAGEDREPRGDEGGSAGPQLLLSRPPLHSRL